MRGSATVLKELSNKRKRLLSTRKPNSPLCVLPLMNLSGCVYVSHGPQ